MQKLPTYKFLVYIHKTGHALTLTSPCTNCNTCMDALPDMYTCPEGECWVMHKLQIPMLRL